MKQEDPHEAAETFTKEFEDEAVRLVRTSGRTQREWRRILGSGYRRWCAGSAAAGIADRASAQPLGEEDVAAELKRLRRENEILRQERDILKRATAFFAKEGSR